VRRDDRLLIEPALVPAVEAAARDRGAAVATLLPADSPPPAFGASPPGDGAPPEPTLVVTQDGIVGGASLGSPAADAALVTAAREALLRGTSRTVEIEGRSVFVEAFPVVLGSSSSVRSKWPGRSSASPASSGYETIVVDGRASFATPERFPPDQVDRLIVGWPDEVAEEIGLGPDDAVAVLTHDVKFDEPAIVEALRRGSRLRRRRWEPQDPGGSARAAAAKREWGRTSWPGCAVRSGSISADATGRDGPRDHGRDHGPAVWPAFSGPLADARSGRRSRDRGHPLESGTTQPATPTAAAG